MSPHRAPFVGFLRVALALFGIALASGEAQAEDLRDVATRVANAWSAAGGDVARHKSRFVMDDETMTLDLRPSETGASSPCRRVALIGSRGMSFHVTGAAGGEGDGLRASSAAGVLELDGCGDVPDWVKLRVDAGRGALETVIGGSSGALPNVSSILLERTGGALPSPPDPGPLPPLPPPSVRAQRSDERLMLDGFEIEKALTAPAGDDGKGSVDLALEEGCHKLGLFAVEPRFHLSGRHAHLDLDGALRRADGEALAEDTSIAPDVRLEACVGVRTVVRATFEGAPRGSSVLVTHASKALPAHLPTLWGGEVRARFARALFGTHVPLPQADPVRLAQGTTGATPVPLELEPGACYLAIAARDRGHGRGRGVAIHVTVGARVSEDERGGKDDAALVAFCAGEERRGRMDVDVRSVGSGFRAAIYRIASGVWSLDR